MLKQIVLISCLATCLWTGSLAAKALVDCSHEGQLFPDPTSCQNYFQCDSDLNPQLFTCGEGLAFSTVTEACDLAVDVDCQDGVRPGDDTTATAVVSTTTGPPLNFTCTAIGELHADPYDCSKFYECDGFIIPAHMTCPDGEYFNEQANYCDYPLNVDCGNRPTVIPTDGTTTASPTVPTTEPSTFPTTEPSTVSTTEPSSEPTTPTTEASTTRPTSGTTSDQGLICAHPGDMLIDVNDCQSFYECDADKIPVHKTCPDGSLYDPTIYNCNTPDNVDCGGRPIPDSS